MLITNLFNILISTYSLNLGWDASPSTNISNYRIWYGTSSHNYTNSVLVGNTLTATITGLKEMRQYFLSATAVDANGVESGFSNEIVYLKPCTLKIVKSQNGPLQVMTISTSAYAGLQFTIEGSSDLQSWNNVYSGTAATDNISVQFNPTVPIAFYRLKKSTTSPALRSMALLESVSEVPELTYREPTAWELKRWKLRNAQKEMKGAEVLMRVKKKPLVKAPPMPINLKAMR